MIAGSSPASSEEELGACAETFILSFAAIIPTSPLSQYARGCVTHRAITSKILRLGNQFRAIKNSNFNFLLLSGVPQFSAGRKSAQTQLLPLSPSKP
ncbi:hypothetical protein Mapa_005151 [Marchantia paleacea]|nr:hypothetical protein Mapa_005151 [Marchantia paleacea]